MTGPEHYLRAEELLSGLSTTHPDPENIATAQVHATLNSPLTNQIQD